MNTKRKAIVLGGTSAHIQLIEKLKEREFYIILIDYYDNPVASHLADMHIKESTLDKDKVLEIAKSMKVDLIITTSIDQANTTAMYVSEKMGLYVPYSYQTSLEVTNKVLMKRIMKDNNIPSSNYMYVKDNAIKIHDLEYPLIVKPADSNGSKGVIKVENPNDLETHLENAIEISRTNQAIVEEFKEGREIGLDCFIKDNIVYILTMRERLKIETFKNSVQQIIRTITPAQINSRIRDELKVIIKNIAVSFGLNNTPLMIQVIVDNNEINVIEFAPRIGGGESSRMIKLITGFDIIDQTINSFLGDKIDINCLENSRYYSETLLYCKSSKFGEVTGYESLLERKIIEYFMPYKSRGMEIGEDMSSINRVGAFVVSGNDTEELNEKINIAIDEIEVFDDLGFEILRKELYYKHLTRGK